MKTSNKLLIGAFLFVLLATTGIMASIGYLAVSEDFSVNALEKKPLSIQPTTTRAQLDSLKQDAAKQGASLKFTRYNYNDKGKLTEIAGKVVYPCCSKTFETDSLKHIAIVKGTEDLKVFVNNEKAFMQSIWNMQK